MTPAARVLLVDESKDDISLVTRELQRASPPMQVQAASSAAALAQALAGAHFDAVVTEHRLSWTTGTDVIRAAKARNPDCPVIMFTGSGGEDVVVEAMKAGLSDYLAKKPLAAVKLPAMVLRAIDAGRKNQSSGEGESGYRRLFDGVPIGLYRSTPAGKILDANAALAEVLGLPSRESALALNAGTFYVDAGDRTRWRARMERDGTVRGFEMRVRLRDGRIRWVRDNACAVRGRSGEVLCYEGSLEDITDLRGEGSEDG